MMIEGKKRVGGGVMWKVVGWVRERFRQSNGRKLLAGSIRRFSGYTANPPAEIYAGTSLQIENQPQFWTYRLP
jgi:hypothetical protein